jgi:hypothetical protein
MAARSRSALGRERGGEWVFTGQHRNQDPCFVSSWISIALNGDGNTLAVGAKWEDSSATGIGGIQAMSRPPGVRCHHVGHGGPLACAQAAEPDAAPSRGPVRRGVQVEGMMGGAACIPGQAPCRYEGPDPIYRYAARHRDSRR